MVDKEVYIKHKVFPRSQHNLNIQGFFTVLLVVKMKLRYKVDSVLIIRIEIIYLRYYHI